MRTGRPIAPLSLGLKSERPCRAGRSGARALKPWRSARALCWPAQREDTTRRWRPSTV